MGTLIDRFEEHDGPVRSVAFHPTQNIFVSGGDDYKIRLWSLQSRKSIAVLSGIYTMIASNTAGCENLTDVWQATLTVRQRSEVRTKDYY